MKVGIKQIIKGLEYHYNNYKKLSEKLHDIDYKGELTVQDRCVRLSENADIYKAMQHEAIAYLNRMGQFYYFAISNKVKRKIRDPKKMIPTIIYFMPFRHKQSAHRGSDYPREDDNQFAMLQLNRVFSSSIVRIEQNVVFQIFLGKAFEDVRQLDILKEHKKIINEAIELLSSFNI
jgi:hypothetical protein